ncbi:hypothetical protein ABT160_42925 [Streptomyces sp. NPDC001941]|uniref:hypothetical protein n=1 Tax=Streptomyces sp. NPDC001941 TaxID=3154659 RepID=UPI003320DBD0
MKSIPRRPLPRAVHALVALLMAVAAGFLAPATAAHAAGCQTDAGAQGLASSPVADSLVSVNRADGRVAQFQLFHDSTATGGLPFVWQRQQAAPGGAYGAWSRVSAATVGPKSYYVTAFENGQGRLEVLFSTYGVFCASAQTAGTLAWSTPSTFGLAPTPYHGGVVLFREGDGSVDAFASGSYSAPGAIELRRQQAPGDAWGPVTSTGAVPEANVGLGQPTSVQQLADGRIRLKAREWNRDRTWQVTQTAPGGSWGTWTLVP